MEVCTKMEASSGPSQDHGHAHPADLKSWELGKPAASFDMSVTSPHHCNVTAEVGVAPSITTLMQLYS